MSNLKVSAAGNDSDNESVETEITEESDSELDETEEMLSSKLMNQGRNTLVEASVPAPSPNDRSKHKKRDELSSKPFRSPSIPKSTRKSTHTNLQGSSSTHQTSSTSHLKSPGRPQQNRGKVRGKSDQSRGQLATGGRNARPRKPFVRYNPYLEAAKPQRKTITDGRGVKRKMERGITVGANVKALWSSGKRSYKAVVVGVNDDGTYHLRYNDGGVWKGVPQDYIVNVRGVKRVEKKEEHSENEEEVVVEERRRKRRGRLPSRRIDHDYRGLTWSEQKNKWIARVYYQNQTYHLGTFSSPHDAAVAYDKQARRLGKKLNFPEYTFSDDSAGIPDSLREGLEANAVAPNVEEEFKEEEKIVIKKKVKKKEAEWDNEANVIVEGGRRRKQRVIYDPIVESQKPQWLKKE